MKLQWYFLTLLLGNAQALPGGENKCHKYEYFPPKCDYCPYGPGNHPRDATELFERGGGDGDGGYGGYGQTCKKQCPKNEQQCKKWGYDKQFYLNYEKEISCGGGYKYKVVVKIEDCGRQQCLTVSYVDSKGNGGGNNGHLGVYQDQDRNQRQYSANQLNFNGYCHGDKCRVPLDKLPGYPNLCNVRLLLGIDNSRCYNNYPRGGDDVYGDDNDDNDDNDHGYGSVDDGHSGYNDYSGNNGYNDNKDHNDKDHNDHNDKDHDKDHNDKGHKGHKGYEYWNDEGYKRECKDMEKYKDDNKWCQEHPKCVNPEKYYKDYKHHSKRGGEEYDGHKDHGYGKNHDGHKDHGYGKNHDGHKDHDSHHDDHGHDHNNEWNDNDDNDYDYWNDEGYKSECKDWDKYKHDDDWCEKHPKCVDPRKYYKDNYKRDIEERGDDYKHWNENRYRRECIGRKYKWHSYNWYHHYPNCKKWEDSHRKHSSKRGGSSSTTKFIIVTIKCKQIKVCKEYCCCPR